MNRRRMISMALVLGTALVVATGAKTADASLIWDGDASKGTGVFEYLERHEGTITVVNDATQGQVFRIYKPSGSNRNEARGVRLDNGTVYVFTNGTTRYFGWRSKLSSTVNNNANFQWKSYGNHIQNYPVILKMISGRMNLMYRAPGENCCRQLWSTPISANNWYHFILGFHISDSASSGWIELYFNGVLQTLSNGSTRYPGRTLDDINKPKWGVYGAMETTVINYVDGLKMGTSAADVGGGSPTPTSTPTATPQPGSPTPTPTATPSGGGFSGYYRITARHSGKAVVVQSASTANGANVIQYTYGGANTNDEWQVVSIGGGYYRIVNRNSGKDLTVESASTADGANIFQYAYGGSNTNDEWAIVDVGGGYFRITNRHSGRSAEVAGGSTSDGANVNQRSYSGATHQQFQLVSIP